MSEDQESLEIFAELSDLRRRVSAGEDQAKEFEDQAKEFKRELEETKKENEALRLAFFLKKKMHNVDGTETLDLEERVKQLKVVAEEVQV
ncbi:hypothetical protein TCAL_16107 [Tigriopus californicus]|uniref:Uncharacterized protein n=1 Tax=Tigriopus californicus TaxID=6832 RepID=A0A553PNC4_TIGCA|nr:hypothetical protein TCAL_16107 [Tigriopus californicus]